MIFLLSFAAGLLFFWVFYRIKLGSFQTLGNQILHRAEIESGAKRSKLELELKDLEYKHQEKLAKQLKELGAKEEALNEKFKQLADLEKQKKQIEKRWDELNAEEEKIAALKNSYQEKIQTAASLDKEEAKRLYMEKIESEMGAYLLQKVEETQKASDVEATKILTTALNRLALPFVSEATLTTLALPSEEMKGRIVGREGRNIRLLEQLTGVNFLLDESPATVVISSVDPIRRAIAKHALQVLIRDGRIHASRIEEVVAKAEHEIEHQGRIAAEKAALKVGVIDLHPELIALLGKLHYSYSFGQNLLEHSLEVGLLMKLIAAELKLDEAKAARMGLLHDIGKAASHEQGLSHAMAGYHLALKYDEPQEVANGIGAHHNEIAPLTIEAQFVAVADAISGGRPGARSEALEHYVKRLTRMEQICLQQEEVEKAYALQAGREVRVIVKPERVNDEAAQALARTLVKKLEKELSFAGKIKVTVIREKKIIDYAS